MARHFAYHNSFGEAQRGRSFSSASEAGAGCDGPVRVVLIAIRHDAQPPVFHGQHLLQRLQALLAAPGDQVELNPQNLHSRFAAQIPPRTLADAFDETALPLLPPRVLPPLPPLPLPPAPGEQMGRQPRLVRGDILSDSAGQLYERCGRQVRPLQRVVSGPRGEILELVANPRTEQVAARRNATANPRLAHAPTGAEVDAHASTQPDPRTNPPEQSSPLSPSAQRNTVAQVAGHAPAARPTAPSQSAAPHRRLRPDPRRLRTARYGEAGPPPSKPPTQPPIPPTARAEARSSQPDHRPISPSPPRTEQQPLPPRAEPPPQPAPQAMGTAPAAGAPDAPQTAIPAQWLKPWELRLSRDEALYDLRAEASARNTIIGAVRSLKRRWGNRQAFEKWQSLLCGKNLDEQLWGVRPPAGQFAHPQVRAWAQRVLAQAGYDPDVMLAEWEIFWRQRGL